MSGPPPGAATLARHERARASAHLDALDVVRVLTVGLVIAVHVLAQQPGGVGLSNGAPLIVLHVSREVFFLLTAFVLVYSRRARAPSSWWAFWRRRYLLIGVPYVVWTAVYYVAGGGPLWPAGRLLPGLVRDLLTGGARYHLYFLLVTMQLYLVFPLLRRLLRATRGRHGWLLAAAAVYQAGCYTAVQRGSVPGLGDPSAYLPSYLGFVVAGGVAAWHAEALMRWTLERMSWVFAGCALAVAAGVVVFFVRASVLRQPPLVAGAVFQPVVVVESVAVAWAFLACGAAWQRRGAPGRRLVRSASDASFGVYLAHPLLLQGLLAVVAASGLAAVAQRQPGPLVTGAATAVVPLIYLACWSAVAVTLRTPLSLALTGRARRGTRE
ncbi:acyltransferase [Dactylosporangium sp. NPDC000244]|uniref:acyltransferase n=1 Tax=Dactylosporangium sp. NPDC000244 TaxID=3154365 RepID=UPI003327B0AC